MSLSLSWAYELRRKLPAGIEMLPGCAQDLEDNTIAHTTHLGFLGTNVYLNIKPPLSCI